MSIKSSYHKLEVGVEFSGGELDTLSVEWVLTIKG